MGDKRGGKRKNTPGPRRKRSTGRGTAGKIALDGAKNRKTGQVHARMDHSGHYGGCVAGFRDRGDAAGCGRAYRRRPCLSRHGPQARGGPAQRRRICPWRSAHERHRVVLVHAQACAQGRLHKISPKHLHRYVAGFAGRDNVRDADTIRQMESAVAGLVGNAQDLTVDNGLPSGARF